MSTIRPAYYPMVNFPLLDKLSEEWKIIRDEYRDLDTNLMNIHRANKTADKVVAEIQEQLNRGESYGWLMGWGGENGANPDWLTYAIEIGGSAISPVEKTMPKTTKMLSNIPGIKVCALNLMKANTFLPVHSHPKLLEEGLLQLHICLDATKDSNYSYLNVNGEFTQHIPGASFIFDGSLEHFAFNASLSTQPRVILYLEFHKDTLFSST